MLTGEQSFTSQHPSMYSILTCVPQMPKMHRGGRHAFEYYLTTISLPNPRQAYYEK